MGQQKGNEEKECERKEMTEKGERKGMAEKGERELKTVSERELERDVKKEREREKSRCYVICE